VGNGNPIKKPRGKIIKKVKMILRENLKPKKLSKKRGRRSIYIRIRLPQRMRLVRSFFFKF